MEKYLQIKNFEGYEIGDLGTVRNIKTGRVIIPRVGKRGYYQLNLRKDNRSYSLKIHRLVAITFLENPNNLPEVDHVDRNKLNNAVSNLRWTTKKINLNNSMFGGSPIITFNKLNGKYLVYHKFAQEYSEYSKISDAVKKFLSLIS